MSRYWISNVVVSWFDAEWLEGVDNLKNAVMKW